MFSTENYFKMTGHQVKNGGSGLMEQFLANNIHNGSPSMVSETHSDSKEFS